MVISHNILIIPTPSKVINHTSRGTSMKKALFSITGAVRRFNDKKATTNKEKGKEHQCVRKSTYSAIPFRMINLTI